VGIDYKALIEPNGNVCKCEMVEYVGLIEKYNHCKNAVKKNDFSRNLYEIKRLKI